jgi:hypothetical protein
MSNKLSHDKNPRGNEPGTDQQTPRHDRQNMGSGTGTKIQGENQGREGGRGSGRNGRSEKGDRARTQRK